MKNAIILHGGPSKEEYYDPKAPSMSNAHWLPWLQGQLLKNEITAATPEVPHSFNRIWEDWVREVERFEIGPNTILIGHSTGAGFWVKYLSIHPDLKVDKVILVAPYLDPYREHTEGFFEGFEIDPNLASKTKSLVVFNSDDDQDTVQKTVKIIQDKIKNLQYREFKGLGHFIHRNLPDDTLPELLEEILK